VTKYDYPTQAANTGTISVDQVRAAVDGKVIAPGDAEYDKARTVFYGGIDRHPAAIVRAAHAGDVSSVVRLARETGAELAVRSGGHSLMGFSVSEGGIVLDLVDLKGLEIDPVARTAWAETGLTAAEVTKGANEYGLAVGFGDTGSVGIGGITTGGGVGYLVRKYGLTIDSVLAAEIVTADGQLLKVDADNYPDLFWAIRGGGGNFGVVTRFKYQLNEVGTILGGMLLLPGTPDVIAGVIAEAEAAPEELSVIANVMPAPPMPFVPAEHHGKIAVMALVAYTGDVEAGQKVVGRLRALATPLADMVRPIPYPELYPPDEEGYHPTGAVRSFFMDSFDLSTAETIVENLNASTAMMRVVQLRVLGGASARVPSDSTAYAHRDRKIMANVAALYQNPAEAPTHEAWATPFAEALRQGTPGVYVNFLSDPSEEGVREAYPGATWDRLRQIKTRYDPTNLFRLNHNIPPAD
jgi:FAD/FMN-containing dehydrogenase